MQEIDYLLLVDDEARQGALRFAEREGGPFLREEGVKRIPPLVELPLLLSAAEHVMEDKDTEEDLRLLFAPGSSLGGARPKASVIEKDGHLAIAKFPRKDDEINTVVWEAVALALAKKAGIAVPAFRVEIIAKKPVLLLRRFDRDGARRIPFLSAMSMLGSKDNETRSYLEICAACDEQVQVGCRLGSNQECFGPPSYVPQMGYGKLGRIGNGKSACRHPSFEHCWRVCRY